MFKIFVHISFKIKKILIFEHYFYTSMENNLNKMRENKWIEIFRHKYSN